MSETPTHGSVGPSTCALARAVGHEERCTGGACALWDAPAGACALRDVEPELLARPRVAEHLLELRHALEAARTSDAEAARLRFFRRLNRVGADGESR